MKPQQPFVYPNKDGANSGRVIFWQMRIDNKIVQALSRRLERAFFMRRRRRK